MKKIKIKDILIYLKHCKDCCFKFKKGETFYKIFGYGIDPIMDETAKNFIRIEVYKNSRARKSIYSIHIWTYKNDDCEVIGCGRNDKGSANCFCDLNTSCYNIFKNENVTNISGTRESSEEDNKKMINITQNILNDISEYLSIKMEDKKII